MLNYLKDARSIAVLILSLVCGLLVYSLDNRTKDIRQSEKLVEDLRHSINITQLKQTNLSKEIEVVTEKSDGTRIIRREKSSAGTTIASSKVETVTKIVTQEKEVVIHEEVNSPHYSLALRFRGTGSDWTLHPHDVITIPDAIAGVRLMGPLWVEAGYGHRDTSYSLGVRVEF